MSGTDKTLQDFFKMPSNVMPFGYMQCTCDKYPKVLYINDRLLNFLTTPEKNNEWKEFISENIFFMIPF